MNAKAGGLSLQHQWKLPRVLCGLQKQTLKLIYAPNPSTLSNWALVCLTEEYP